MKSIELLYETTRQLFEEHGAKTPSEYAKEAYDRTDFGVWTTFITRDEEIPSHSLTKQQDTAQWAIRHVVGIKHGTIVEGSDAETEADALLFPFTDEELAEAWEYCEGFANENWTDEDENEEN